MLRRMSDARPFECRWIKRKIPGSFKITLQQYLPLVGDSVFPTALRRCEWIDVPVMGEQNEESTVRVAKNPSGPQEAPTMATTALEPVMRTPEELEQVIEKQVLVVTGLMKMRSEMSGFPPYDGTLILVHGTGKQRMFVNGFERTIPSDKCFQLTKDEDVHNFQNHTIAPGKVP